MTSSQLAKHNCHFKYITIRVRHVKTTMPFVLDQTKINANYKMPVITSGRIKQFCTTTATYLTDKQHMLEPQFCIDINTNHCASVRLSYLVMVVYCNPSPFLYSASLNFDAFLLIANWLETDPLIYGFKICIVHSRVTGALSRSWNFIHQN